MSDVIEDGRKARQLLASGTFKDTVALVRSAAHAKWEKAETTAEREAEWATVKGLNSVIKQLEITAERGKHAEENAPATPRA